MGALYSNFRRVYQNGLHQILENSPELLFMEAVCAGDTEKACAFFEENTQFGGKSEVNSPHGIFRGKQEIGIFTEGFLKSFQADGAMVCPVIQTRAGGRSATEMTIQFARKDGDLEIPMCVVGDLRPAGQLDNIRIYFFFQWVEGFSPYRKPIFKSNYQGHAELALMTGAVRKYFEALHTEGGLEDIMNIMEDDIWYGEYRPEQVEGMLNGKKQLRGMYECICADAPSKYSVRGEAITDDGVNCVVEWNLMITEEGKKAKFLHVPGVAVYERGESGRLCSIRICDDNGFFQLLTKETNPELFNYYESQSR